MLAFLTALVIVFLSIWSTVGILAVVSLVEFGRQERHEREKEPWRQSLEDDPLV